MRSRFDRFNFRRELAGFDPWRNAPADCAFYPRRAREWCAFFERHLKLARGDGYMGKNIRLMEWQTLFVGWLFGWLHKDGRRRFDTAFVYIPKKNGKSAFTSALAAALFIADGETDKKIYCAANVKKQAGLVFNDAVYMVENTGIPPGSLRGANDLSRKEVIFTPTRSLLTAISREAKNTEGVEPSAAIVDELHTMPDGLILDVLRKGMVTRRNPLMIYLTTAARQGENVCNDELDFARRVRDGKLDAPNYLPVIFELREGDDWKSEKVWRRVNPGWGITIKPERFRTEFKLALDNPKREIEFKRLNLNLQARGAEAWIDAADWDACPDDLDPSALLGEPCTMGLDLSAVHDITALVLYFPKQNAVLPYFFVPRDTAADRDDYRIWAKKGLLTICGERCISEVDVRAKIQELAGGYDEATGRRIKGLYKVVGIAYDPWRMSALSAKLHEVDELNMVPWRQGYITMAEPTAAVEREILEHKLRHFRNPVLSWMFANATAKVDPRGNTMITKDVHMSKRKVDGVVATIMAYGLAHKPETAELLDDTPFEMRFLDPIQ